jgi:hypothetical protein
VEKFLSRCRRNGGAGKGRNGGPKDGTEYLYQCQLVVVTGDKSEDLRFAAQVAIWWRPETLKSELLRRGSSLVGYRVARAGMIQQESMKP